MSADNTKKSGKKNRSVQKKVVKKNNGFPAKAPTRGRKDKTKSRTKTK